MSVHKWDKKFGLIVWLSFIDDMLIVCSEDTMESIKKEFMEMWIAMTLER